MFRLQDKNVLVIGLGLSGAAAARLLVSRGARVTAMANSDTPGARAVDLKPFDFATLVKRRSMQIDLAATQVNHLAGNRKRVDMGDTETRRSYETAPTGNAVVLEEQMMKLSENEVDYKLTTELYRKHLGLFRKALGRG